MTLPIEVDPIEVFPDSGHHLRFVGLMPVQDGTQAEVCKRMPDLARYQEFLTDSLKKKLTRICESEKDPWRVKDDLSWVLYRFGTYVKVLPDGYRARLLGVWLAVESNLGPVSRGYVTQMNRPPNQEEVAFYNETLGNLPRSPYAHEKLQLIQPDSPPVTLTVGIDDDPLCTMAFHWVEPDSHMPIEVDLVIDFGNTRTAVMALEHRAGESNHLSVICKPIPFHERDVLFEGHDGFNFDYRTILLDSWFLLHEPRFVCSEPVTRHVCEWEKGERLVHRPGLFARRQRIQTLDAAIHRMPQMFVELSPALLGPSATQELMSLDLRNTGNYCLSSPKRYAWDTDMLDGPGQQDWHMQRNSWRRDDQRHSIVSRIPTLEGEVLRFIPSSGRDWKVDHPPTTWPQDQRPSDRPPYPLYPRSETLTWTALAIIETAYRTIMSAAWRRRNRPYGSRRLGRVVVTYPAGWTASEIEAYRAKWQKAINIFAHTRLRDARSLPDGGEAPVLDMSMNEAIASQLPIIYAEIHRMGSIGSNWLEIVGRGKGVQARARIMTIDIGGGTTDVSVVDYQDLNNGAGVDLHATVLFKDSSTVAGDLLRKMLIEHVLLPVVLGGKAGIDVDRLEHLFSAQQADAAGYARWSRITRVVLLPIVNRWLADLVAKRQESFTFGDLFQTGMEDQILKEFNAEAEAVVGGPLLDIADNLTPPAEMLKQCISRCFSASFATLAKHVAAFECDMIIVTGKPSELPYIKELLAEHLPILSNRLIFAYGYRAKSCWPFSADGRVNDAKLVTVVGAALCKAIERRQISDWSITICPSRQMLTQNWWGAMPQRGHDFLPVYLAPDDREKTVSMMVGTQIGRKKLLGDTAPEPVYILRWTDSNMRHRGGADRLNITLRRVPPTADGEPESLMIVNASRPEPAQGDMARHGGSRKPVTADDVELKLCTLRKGERYWLDSGRFEICRPHEGVAQ